MSEIEDLYVWILAHGSFIGENTTLEIYRDKMSAIRDIRTFRPFTKHSKDEYPIVSIDDKIYDNDNNEEWMNEKYCVFKFKLTKYKVK